MKNGKAWDEENKEKKAKDMAKEEGEKRRKNSDSAMTTCHVWQSSMYHNIKRRRKRRVNSMNSERHQNATTIIIALNEGKKKILISPSAHTHLRYHVLAAAAYRRSSITTPSHLAPLLFNVMMVKMMMRRAGASGAQICVYFAMVVYLVSAGGDMLPPYGMAAVCNSTDDDVL